MCMGFVVRAYVVPGYTEILESEIGAESGVDGHTQCVWRQ